MAVSQAPALLGFTVAGRTYALPLGDVEAVRAACPAPTSFADGGPVVSAAVERGGILPVVALARLLGHPRPAANGPLVVARPAAGRVGLLVDGLRGIFRLPAERLDAVPAILAHGAGDMPVDRIARYDDGSLVSVLSAAKLFDEAMRDRLPALDVSDLGTTPAVKEERRERFVAVGIGSERFGFPVAAVAEVLRRPGRLAAVPGMNPSVLGAMAFRGRSVPVIDVGDRLGLTAGGARGGGPALILAIRGAWVALRTDAALGMIEIEAKAIAPVPVHAPSSAAKSRDMRGRVVHHHGHRVVLVDPESVLDEAGRAALAALGQSRSEMAATA